jgi:CBS domain containing-hemolysin-like protein
MTWLGRLFSPVVWLLNRLGEAFIHLLGVVPTEARERLFTPEELEYIVDESSAGGLLEPAEQLFFQNILDLQERTVEQIMTPRTRLVGLPVTASREVVMRKICESRKSRYPIYEGTIDQIIGVLHIKDLARYMIHHPDQPWDLRELARETFFVPESLPLDRVLSRFRGEQSQMAIIIDEFGGVAGILTLEDLEEEVVGEIQDEFDREPHPIQELSSHRLRVRGDLLLSELKQLYGVELEHPEAHTVGGLVMTLLGRIPRSGDVARYHGVEITVESVERLAVNSVIIQLPG